MKALFIVGPTGIGKSSIACSLAQRINGIIINADSRQLYKDIPIITAQPRSTETNLVPHKLYGYLPIQKKISAGIWSQSAVHEIATAIDCGYIPILVGGTGMYMKALLDGITSIPEIPNAVTQHVEQRYQTEGLEVLYHELESCDAEYAQRIHKHDRQRILRALMVFKATGIPFTTWHKNTIPFHNNLSVLQIGIRCSLTELLPHIRARVDSMLKQGALEELINVYKTCKDPNAHGYSSIGCRELMGIINKTHTMEEIKHSWIQNTRSYAKRQLTWFNSDKRIHWFKPDDMTNVYKYVQQWL